MYQTILNRLVVVGGLLAGASFPLHATDALWEQTIAFVKNCEHYLPGSIESQQVVLDEKGQEKSSSNILIKLDQHGGTLVGFVEHFYENGVEKASKNREAIDREIAEGLSENLIEYVWDIPFTRENISELAVHRLPQTKMIASVECVGYRFKSLFNDRSIPNGALGFKGTVWVEPNTGIPTRIESVLIDDDVKFEGANIVGLTRDVDFCYTDGQWKKIHKRQEMWLQTSIFFKNVSLMVSNEVDYADHFVINSEKS